MGHTYFVLYSHSGMVSPLMQEANHPLIVELQCPSILLWPSTIRVKEGEQSIWTISQHQARGDVLLERHNDMVWL